MKGDYTRFSFDKSKHVHQVLKQQGRVDLEADWNEQSAVEAYRREQGVADLIGQTGAPMVGGGFLLTPGGPDDLGISEGRIYVDGILVENESQALPLTIKTQPFLPLETLQPPTIADGTQEDTLLRTDLIYLDVWQHHLTALDDPKIREVALGGPDTTTRLRTLWRVRVQENSGTGECAAPIIGFPAMPTGQGLLTTTLDPVVAPTDPCLIGEESGGYRLLENRLYRVEIHDGGTPEQPATFKYAPDNGAVVYGVESITNDHTLILTRRGKDAVLSLAEEDWVEVVSSADEARGIPGVMRQISIVNDLEITINQPLPPEYSSLATIPPSPFHDEESSKLKVRRWSENLQNVADAVLATPVPLIDKREGGDEVESGIKIHFEGNNFRSGDYWTFAARTITGDLVDLLTAALPEGVRHHYAKLGLIKWYSRGKQRLVRVPDGGTGYVHDLANHWSIFRDANNANKWTWRFEMYDQSHSGHTAAETAAAIAALNNSDPAGVITSFESVTSSEATATAPALVDIILTGENVDLLAEVAKLDLFTSTTLVARYTIVDCRPQFPAATDLINLHYVSGDGQEARPGALVPRPLIVRVAKGSHPLVGALVDFTVISGDGTIQSITGQASAGTPLTVATNSNGFAAVNWTLDADPPDGDPSHDTQQVLAALRGYPHMFVIFNANLDLPAEDEAGVKIKRVFWGFEEPIDAWNDRAVTLDHLATTLNMVCSAPVDAKSISRATCYMTLDIPQEEELEGLGVEEVVYFPIVLAATVGAGPVDGNAVIHWQATAGSRRYVQRLLQTAIENDRVHPLLLRFLLKGNFIYQEESVQTYLDGEAFGAPDGTVTHNLRLPSGNGRRGGDFEMWFWLTERQEGPIADFTFVVVENTFSVNFRDASTPTGEISSWAWTFFDENGTAIGTHSQQHPTFNFQRAGTFTASLTVGNADGVLSEPVSKEVPVPQLPIEPVGVLRWIVDGVEHAIGPDMFNPVATAHTQNKTVIDLIYAGLLRADEENENGWTFDLAESFEFSEDGSDVTFHLREGMVFSDGNPLLAEDVKFSLDRARNMLLPGAHYYGAVYLYSINEIEVVDELTVRIILKGNGHTRFFLLQLTTPPAKIVSKAQVDPESGSHDPNWRDQPVTSGPYKLVEAGGNRVQLSKHDGYWQPAGVIDLVVGYVNSFGEALVLFEDDEADVIGGLQNGIPVDLSQSGLQEHLLETNSTCGLRFIGMNFPKMEAEGIGSLDDRAVREAMGFAVDREGIASQVFGLEIGEPAGSLIPPCLNPEVPGEHFFDLESAKVVLDEAGWGIVGEDGIREREGVRLSLSLAFVPEGVNEKVVSLLIENWNAIGIEVGPTPIGLYDFGLVLDKMFSDPIANDFHIYYSFWGADYMDPQNVLTQQLHSAPEGAEDPTDFWRHANNNGRYASERFDGLVDFADVQSAPNHWEPYFDADNTAREDSARIPVYYPFPRALVRPTVTGFRLAGAGLTIPNFSDLTKS